MILIATSTGIDNHSKSCRDISNVLAETKICLELFGPLIFLAGILSRKPRKITHKERKKLKTDRI
jgi:hypothetical protein